MDGECFDGKEAHVWISIKKFEDYQVGVKEDSGDEDEFAEDNDY